jgi:hypothetical protein
MSAFTDELHKIFGRLSKEAPIVKEEVDALIKAAETHFSPAVAQLRADVVADVKKLIEDLKTDLLAAVKSAESVVTPAAAGQTGEAAGWSADSAAPAV